MAINIGDKEVKKIAVGDKVIMDTTTSGSWVKLESPDSTAGDLLFKNNGNGTSYLTGAVNFTGGQYRILIAKAPAGYAFNSIKRAPLGMSGTQTVVNSQFTCTDGDIYCSNITWSGNLFKVACTWTNLGSEDTSFLFSEFEITKK